MSQEDKDGQHKGHPTGTRLADTTMVCGTAQAQALSQASRHTSPQPHTAVASKPSGDLPIGRKVQTVGHPSLKYIWCHYMNLSERAWEIFSNGWSASTMNSYEGPARRWMEYTQCHNIRPVTPSVHDCIAFLTQYLDTGVGYNAVNTYRSFLSCFIRIDNVPLGEHTVICKFMKGVKAEKPPGRRYDDIWDPVPILHHLARWGGHTRPLI